ncbi:MAG: hypothetical protein WBI07_17715 [Mobilitalea sp.]
MDSKMDDINKEFEILRIHLELSNEWLTDDQKRIMNKYAESSNGKSISRDILIPSDMPLHNLHYTIQRLFGWQNSHLRKFCLPETCYKKLTRGTVKGWAELVGVLFQPPSEGEHDVFWDDDYQSGSIKAWLKKKYTGPYSYGGQMEYIINAKKDMKELLDRFQIVDVRESFHEYYERKLLDENAEMRLLGSAPLIELTLEEMNNSIMIEQGTESLLEKLEVNKVLAYHGEECAIDGVFPVSEEIIYNYDFGDDWTITVTKREGYDDLLKKGVISEKELKEAEAEVLAKHKPVCIFIEGGMVMDDVGGLSGFADFLGKIYENVDDEESNEYLAWAQSLGWSERKISNKMIL